MSNDAPESKWFLRIASGAVYGPVAVDSLKSWAEQGRIIPGNEVSSDGKEWLPASSIPELGLEWYLEDSNGNRNGPYNRAAAEKLVASGRVGDGVSLVHDDGDAAEEEADASGEDEAQSPEAEDVAVCDSEPEAAESVDAEADDGQTEFNFGANDKTAISEEEALARVDKAVAAATAPLVVRISELEGDVKRTDSIVAATVADETSRLQAKVAELEAALKASRETAATAERNASESASRVAELEAAVKEARDSAVAADKKAADGASRVADLEVALKVADEASAAAQARCVELEKKLGDSEKNYSDLLAFSNDRDARHEEELAKARSEQDSEVARLKTELMRTAKAAGMGMDPDSARILEELVETERSFLVDLQAESVKTANLIQNRIAEVARLRENGISTTELRAKVHSGRVEFEHMREDLENLRVEHARTIRDADRRENEQKTRLRVLEGELELAKASAADADALRQRIAQMDEMLHDRDQALAKERQRRAFDQEQLEQAQQALMARIQDLESKVGTLPLNEEKVAPAQEQDLFSQAPEQPRAHQQHGIFRVAPWLKVKK